MKTFFPSGDTGGSISFDTERGGKYVRVLLGIHTYTHDHEPKNYPSDWSTPKYQIFRTIDLPIIRKIGELCESAYECSPRNRNGTW